MSRYHKYLRSWTNERNITSFLGSDKQEFLADWKDTKTKPVRPLIEVKEKIATDAKGFNAFIKAQMEKQEMEKREMEKKPIPIELIMDDVKALPPISIKKQENFKKFTNIVGSKEFNDTIEEAIKDIYYDQLGGLFPREKIYKDKFLTLSKKNQDKIRATVRAKLMKVY